MVDQRKTSGGWSVLAVLLLFLLVVFPVLYVLGSGPMHWLILHDYVDRDVGKAVYYPLEALEDRSEAFSAHWQAYLEHWY